MTIAYLIDCDPHLNSGVMQKIEQQTQQWVLQGHTLYLISLKTMTVYNKEKNSLFKTKASQVRFGQIGTAIDLLHNAALAPALFDKISFDLIYTRYRLYMPFINKVLKKYPVIMEINSDDLLEYRLHSQMTSIYNRLTRDLFLKNIDAFISVSHELKQKFLYLEKPIDVIANGIDTTACPFLTYKNNKSPTLVFIGTPQQPWQGLEKIEMLARHFQEYHFYIIGTDGTDTQNLRYLGYLSAPEANKVIARCDIGIGTLSLYQKGMNEASPLKSRQYLACGLPLIYAYQDTDIPDDASFALQLKNREENLDYPSIKAFIENVFARPDIAKEARRFAEEVLNYEHKEKARLSFFKKVLDEK